MGKDSVAQALCEGTPLERLLYDVEEGCGRAVLVLSEARERIVRLADDDEPILIAALETITRDLNELANRALDARTPDAPLKPVVA